MTILLVKMKNPPIIKLTNKGMINIPVDFQKQYDIHDGDTIAVIEDEDGLRVIQVKSIVTLRQRSISSEKL